MSGRYGPDHLNVALIILSFLLGIVSSLSRLRLLTYVSYVPLALAVIRLLSRNIPSRRRENDRFLRYWSPLKTRAKHGITRFRERKTHAYFKCPACRKPLRVPRGKGKLQITCPKCGERFVKKT
jgi:DNA-directed RNA polymerase subunit RPC12/RpoP